MYRAVLPGVGWDNLRNLEASLVVAYNFTLCKVTDDGNFLIPDSVFTIPIKTSKVERFAELIDQWQTSSSLTANSINVEAGLALSQYSISGMYSNENQDMTSKQYEDIAMTARVQMIYDRYEAKLQPDPVLSPQFKSRLLSIAARIELNQTEQARYEGQLLIRDFGTHVLTSVTAGAVLVKDDYILKSYIELNAQNKRTILTAASASFMRIFNFSSSFRRRPQADIEDEDEICQLPLKKFTSRYRRRRPQADIEDENRQDEICQQPLKKYTSR
ncbi:Macrophage-expressed protein 1 protein [Bulinus truncatus]|nr:Macrophage-expressed protein 1 protein [Bulinus truncatus]